MGTSLNSSTIERITNCTEERIVHSSQSASLGQFIFAKFRFVKCDLSPHSSCRLLRDKIFIIQNYKNPTQRLYVGVL